MSDNFADDLGSSCTILQHSELEGFALCDSRFDTPLTVPSHSHDESHLTLVLEGGCDENYLRRSQLLSPLRVSYFHPGETHSLLITRPPFRTFDVRFNRDWLGHFSDSTIAPDALMDQRNTSLVPLLTRMYNEFREMDDLSPLAMEGLALAMLADLVRASRNYRNRVAPRWLLGVIQRLHDEFADPLSLSELARSAGVHPSHLAEVFRAHYQCTPGDYLRRLRIERATKLMATPDASLATIAVSVGFSDQSHFSRFFKRATGQTPAQFRRLNFGQHTKQHASPDK